MSETKTYRCAGALCPGLPYPASLLAHPASCGDAYLTAQTDIWTLREAIVRAGLGNHADSQQLSFRYLVELWRQLRIEQPDLCRAVIEERAQ